jgi:hypothetical protein
MKSGVKKMNTKDFEVNSEEIEIVAKHQDVCKEEAAVETVGIWVDPRLTVGSGNPVRIDQGQCCTKKTKRTDVREGTSGAAVT